MESSPILVIGEIIIVKMAVLSKAIYMFNSIPVKILVILFTEVGSIEDHE
jgi:hypothetical protein